MKTFAIILCLSVLLGHAIADGDKKDGDKNSILGHDINIGDKNDGDKNDVLGHDIGDIGDKNGGDKYGGDNTELELVKGYTVAGDYKFDKKFFCHVSDLKEVQDVISEGHCPKDSLKGRRLLLETDSTSTRRALLTAASDLNATLSSGLAQVAADLASALDNLDIDNSTAAGRRHLLDDKHPIEVSVMAKESLLAEVAKVVVDLSKAKQFLYKLKYVVVKFGFFETVSKACAVAYAPKEGIVSLDYDTEFFVKGDETATPRLIFEVKDDKLPKFGIVVEFETYFFGIPLGSSYTVYPAYDASVDLKPSLDGLSEDFN